MNEIGQQDIVVTKKEKANDFIDLNYNIVNSDEDLIDVLKETGQLKKKNVYGNGKKEMRDKMR